MYKRQVVVFAHPTVYKSMPLLRELVAEGAIDGIEVHQMCIRDSFYSPERLKAFFENAAALSRKDNLDQNDFFGLVRSVMGQMCIRDRR